MGITQHALAADVPVCVVPWGRDQLEVARRVVTANAGTTVSRGKLSASTLRVAARDARAKRNGAERVRDAFAKAGGAGRCAELVEALLHSRSSTRAGVSGVRSTGPKTNPATRVPAMAGNRAAREQRNEQQRQRRVEQRGAACRSCSRCAHVRKRVWGW